MNIFGIFIAQGIWFEFAKLMIMKPKIKNNFWVFIFYLLLVLMQLGCTGIKSDSQKLKEEITGANAENEKLKKELNALITENSNMHVRLAQLNLQISALEMEIQNLQRDLDSVKSQFKESANRNKRS
jgi:predicted nuclease with TOPRIM domain